MGRNGNKVKICRAVRYGIWNNIIKLESGWSGLVGWGGIIFKDLKRWAPPSRWCPSKTGKKPG